MTTILLIRHGLTDFVGKRLAGHLPGIHLNKVGLDQAKGIADLLQPTPIKAIFSSPLERSIETAQPMAIQKNLEIEVIEALAEINFGSWQGKTVKQIQRMKMWETVRENPSKVLFPNGESFVEAKKRLIGAMEYVLRNSTSEDYVACFSHSDSIRILLTHFLNMPIDSFQRIVIDTASISVIRVGDNEIRVGPINYVTGLNINLDV
jgi:broad specificity phosphatase PhoE